MKIALPREVSEIIFQLEDEGFEAFAVGGCIRDSLLNRNPKDWDITTNALPEEIKKVFKYTIDTGIDHGTVTVRKNKKSFEVTTYRTDGKYKDARHPEKVTFVKSLKEDLRRRDFTINALAYNDKTGIVDEFGGIRDLENKIIKCVDDPGRRLSEDALRMLRGVRFVAQLGFSLDEDTKEAIKQLAPLLSMISAERICDEFTKLITSPRPEAICLMYELGLTKVFFPEWDKMMETNQNTKHHIYSVGEHTVAVMQNTPEDRKLRFAALLHDVAKPISKKTDERGNDHFAGHPQIGAKIAECFMKRLKMDNDTIGHVSRLVRYHDDRPPISKRTVRRLVNRVGEDILDDLFVLKRADVLAQSDYKKIEKLNYIDEFKACYEEILKDSECINLKDLAIKGKDVIEAGFPAGPAIGAALSDALEWVLDEPARNEKEMLIKYIKEHEKR